MKILASAATPGMTLWNDKVITKVETNPSGQTAISFAGRKNRDWFLPKDLIDVKEPARAGEGGYPLNTCRIIYPHGDKQRVCCRVMGHDGAHSPRDRERFPDIYDNYS